MSTIKNVSPIGRDLPSGATVPPGGLAHDIDLDPEQVHPEVATALSEGWFVEMPPEPSREDLIKRIGDVTDLAALDHLEKAERDRADEPRKTVLDAIAKQRRATTESKEQTS